MISPVVAAYGVCILLIVCSAVTYVKSMLKVCRRIKLHGLPKGMSMRMLILSNILTVIGLCASGLIITLCLFSVLH